MHTHFDIFWFLYSELFKHLKSHLHLNTQHKGMLFYFVGSIWFLPGFEDYTDMAAESFVMGSIMLMCSSVCLLYSIENPDPGRTIYFHFPSLERSYQLNEEWPCPKTVEFAKEYVRKRVATL